MGCLSLTYTLQTQKRPVTDRWCTCQISQRITQVFFTHQKIIYTFLSSFYFKRAGRFHWEKENQNCGWRFNLMPCTKLSFSPQTNIPCIHTWNNAVKQSLRTLRQTIKPSITIIQKRHFKNTRRWAVPKAAIQRGLERVVFVSLADLTFVLPQISKYCFLICSHTAQ